ncbi:MAG TPA: hypothetical protein VF171_01250 [Trueperaceae bacterium]
MNSPASASPRALRVWLVTFLLLTLCSGAVRAQTLSIGSALSFRPPGLKLEPEVLLRDVKQGALELDFRLAGLAAGPLEFGVGTRASLSYGPIGTVQLSGHANANTMGAFRVSLVGAGVITSVAARAQLRVFNVDAGSFALSQAYRTDAGPRTGSSVFGVSLALGGSYRLGRRLIIDLDPGVRYLAGVGLGAHLTGALEFRDLVDRDDGVLLLLADLAAGGAEGYAAAGFEYRLSRRDLPLVRASLWLGAGTRGVLPGVRLAVTEAGRGSPVGYGFEFAIEPYRHDALPFRSRNYVTTQLGTGQVMLETVVGLDPSRRLPPFAASVHYSLPLR